MKKTGKILSGAGIALIALSFTAANIAASMFAPMITTYVCGTGVSFSSKEFEEAAASSDALCQNIAEEGIALIKNDNHCLPLKGKKINVLGWSSSDQGFLLSGIGSGSTTINDSKKVTFLDALKDDGYEVNQAFVDLYNNYDSANYGYSAARIPLVEPSINYYTDALMEDAAAFSDTAVMVVSRIAGENVGEVPLVQVKSHKQGTDTSRHYLELSSEEEKLLAKAEDYFKHIVLVINSSNQMQIPQLKTDSGIEACLVVGLLGQSGTRAIPKILSGEVNPSGRLTDTWAYDYKTAPSFVNSLRDGDHIQYREGLYFGYRWYETAAKEGYFSDVDNNYGKGYDGVVNYPFGYGLSYSSFQWTLTSATLPNGGVLSKDAHVKLTFSCKNVGESKGKDVLQLYCSTPYQAGGIEKSSISLVDFAKSSFIDPGQEQTGISMEFDPYDLSSYDAYDRNGNGKSTYEMDKGDYTLSFQENSHALKSMSNGVTSLTYHVPETLVFDKDPVTGNNVNNRFTGADAYAGVPIDGTTVFSNSRDPYLSRGDFEGTFPTKLRSSTANSSVVAAANAFTNSSYDTSSMPTTGVENGLLLATKSDGSVASYDDLKNGNSLQLNDALLQEIGSDYNSKKLDDLVNEMSVNEACSIVEDSGFGTPAVASIGKPRLYDFDGPAGFNANTQTTTSSGKWTAFPNETLIGQTFSKYIAKQMGLSMGAEGNATGLTGWYAPGVNLHRTPFNGRNYEYYSEDPILSGDMAAALIEGAKANGLTCYLKHLCLSEPGVNPRGLNTWLTEQTYREIYLKPFEIAVKKGGANAMMTAFNFVGGVWAGANYAQNVSIVRDEWGFRGSIITDWSSGDSVMNPSKGVRAGNDIWLNPNTGNNGAPLDRGNPTSVYCAKLASKNVIFTFANTYAFAKNYDHSSDQIKVNIGETKITPPFPWWIPLLVGIDAVVGGALVTWGVFAFRKKKPQKNN